MIGPAPSYVGPPWHLTGSAVVLLYRFPRGFVQAQAGLPPQLQAKFVGGIGAVMCIDYSTSDVGPYHELLFIPGQVRAGGRRRWTISRIYVSTSASVTNGIRNWAIPKRQARFAVEERATRFGAGVDDRDGFELCAVPFGPVLPVDSRWLPLAAELAQPATDRMLVTRPEGRGAVRLARVERLVADRAFFPDISSLRPLAAVHVPQFELCFPTPRAMFPHAAGG